MREIADAARYTTKAARRDAHRRRNYSVVAISAATKLAATSELVVVGSPEINSALAAWRNHIALDYQMAAFTVNGKTYTSERNGLVYAAKNPHDPSHMVVGYAGNSPLETACAIEVTGETAAIVLEDGKAKPPPAGHQAN